MQQTSWLLRPVMPLMLLPYLLLITAPSTGTSNDFRDVRLKRSPYGNLGQTQLANKTEPASDTYQKKLADIFYIDDRPGVTLFNDTSELNVKVQRLPNGQLQAVFNNELVFQTTTSATPENNKNTDTSNLNRNSPPYRNTDVVLFPNDEYICPERREGKSYCTEVPNYLEMTKLDRISPEKFEKFKSYFKDDLIQPQNVTQRMNSEPLEEYYCSSSSRLIYPKTAETKESKWLLVVQHDDHRQGILVEQCDAEEKPCRFEESLPRFYTSLCKQHYVFRTMVVSVNGEMREEQVKMPNCCKCVLRNTGGPRKT